VSSEAGAKAANFVNRKAELAGAAASFSEKRYSVARGPGRAIPKRKNIHESARTISTISSVCLLSGHESAGIGLTFLQVVRFEKKEAF
jgi:hypothetical protein